MINQFNLSEVVYRFADENELIEVIKLRTEAYKGTGKFDGESLFNDVFDEKAFHLTAFYESKPIASLRMMFHNHGDEWEHDRFFQWPNEFPSRLDVVEITRVCVHKDFRHTGVLQQLLKECALNVLRNNRSWILGCATDQLMKLYQKIGCVPTKISFSHDDLGKVKHTIFLADIRSGLSGNINPILWIFFWRETAQKAYIERVISFPNINKKIKFNMLYFIGYLAKPLIKIFAR